MSFWQVASVLLGFQITAFTFRISREFSFRDRKRRWFPPADYLNIASMIITIFGVYCLPIIRHSDELSSPTYWFGLSLVLFAFYPLALLGHYELFSKDRGADQKRVTGQEIFILVISIIIAFLYGYSAY